MSKKGTPARRLVTMIVAYAAALGASAAAWASADTSPKPGGVYRLKPGIYVAAGSSCEAPANAAIRRYDGKGLNTAHSRSCKAAVASRKRSAGAITYTVDQNCIDSGAGPGKRFTQRQKVTVEDALTFNQTIGGDRTAYRYCPIDALPADLRKAAR